jgi:phage shock protein A
MKTTITQFATLYSSVLNKKKKVGDLIEFIQTEKDISIANQQRLALSIHSLDSSFAELEKLLECLKDQKEDIALNLWDRYLFLDFLYKNSI